MKKDDPQKPPMAADDRIEFIKRYNSYPKNNLRHLRKKMSRDNPQITPMGADERNGIMKKWKAYPKYKDSGVQWLGEVPEGWEVWKLSHLTVRIGSGKTPSGGAEVYQNEGIPFIRSQNVYDDGLRLDDIVYIDESIDEEMAWSRIFPNDILLNITGASLGRTCIVPKDFGKANVNQHVCAIRMEQSENSYYIAGYFKSAIAKAYYDFAQNGSGREGLNFEQIGTMQIPLPPLPEQKAIAAFLDQKTAQIDRLIEKKKALIERLNEKRTALITESVTGKNLAKILDEEKVSRGAAEHAEIKYKDSGVEWLGEIPEEWDAFPMRRVTENVKTGTTPSGADEIYYSEDGINWYTPGDFIGEISLGEAKRKLSEEGIQEVRIFPPFTVLLVGIGATIGKVAVILEKSSFNQQINGISYGEGVDPLFAAYFLTTLKDYIVKCGKYTTLPIINQDETKSLPFICPPLSEQKAIAAFLDRKTTQIDQMKEKVQAAIEKLQEYRTSLITAAVTGKIDVRGEV